MAELSVDQQGAADRLRALAIWPAAPRIFPCAGGRTNQNFRVDADAGEVDAAVGLIIS